MLIDDESIVIIKQQGFSETRRVIPAVKCMRFGQYATSLVELPKSNILDDMIWEWDCWTLEVATSLKIA